MLGITVTDRQTDGSGVGEIIQGEQVEEEE